MAAPLTQLTEVWSRLKVGQRVAVCAAAAATLALVAALVYFSSQPEYGVLFSELKPADAQAIVEKLKAESVPYSLTQGGTMISVPQERVSELRLQLASSGAISGGHVGFDLFDRTSFGATDFTQQVNYRRAVEGELAKTLEGVEEVESARVHITPARESLFTEKNEQAKASIMLRVRQGRELARERTEAIVSLVASAVEHLDAGDVSVMDTQGRLLWSGGTDRSGLRGDAGKFNSHLEARRKLEAEMAARVVSLLEPISGANGVRADVAADVDFSQIEQTEEKFDPKSAVIRSQQSMQEVKNGTAGALGGIVGARANDPAVQTQPKAAASPAATANGTTAVGGTNAPSNQREATTVNYEIDKTVKHTTSGGGRITRLSVSVVVDYKTVNGVGTVRTPEELKTMQELVGAAVGLDQTRGDQIVVQSIPFNQPAAAETKQASWLEQNRELTRTAVKYSALVVVAVLVLLFVVRPARKALSAASAAAPARLAMAAGPAGGPFAALPAGNSGVIGGAVPASASGLALGEPNALLAATSGPRTVAEIEAEMSAGAGMAAASFNAARAGEVKQALLQQSQQDPELIAKTMRSWLQETP